MTSMSRARRMNIARQGRTILYDDGRIISGTTVSCQSHTHNVYAVILIN